MPFISRLGEDLQEKMATRPGVWVHLDPAEWDVMSLLANDYPYEEGSGPGNAAQQLQRRDLKIEFQLTAVSINPSFGRYSANDLWTTASRFKHGTR